MRRAAALGRWSPFLVGCAVTAVLALGFGGGVSWLVASSRGPAPVLRTIPPGTLQRYGITLAAAPQPPYCGLAENGPVSRWLREGLAGCAISRSAAEAAATRGASGTIQESVLARVTANGTLRIGKDRLAWLVVLRGGFGPQRVACPIAAASVQVPCPVLPALSLTRVVIVDGLTGQVAAVVIVGAQWAGAASPGLPWVTTVPGRMVPLPEPVQ
ncbi:MAG TPA: hypothetical protein VFD49_24095 [Candidatus Dormibacteraeota bacterium]|nr:hypothetical protein [Candidatus Dormibacteraeota bacterium]